MKLNNKKRIASKNTFDLIWTKLHQSSQIKMVESYQASCSVFYKPSAASVRKSEIDFANWRSVWLLMVLKQ